MHAINTDQGVCTLPNHFLDHALELARLGIRVHPLVPRNKNPTEEDYQHIATKDEATIRAWWTTQPDLNIGIITGASSGVFALDIDRRHGGYQSLEALEAQYGELPITWQTTTHDGFHIFFRYPTTGQIASRYLADGIQLMSDGHNLVATGSIHPDGHRYHWSEFCSPDMIPLADPPPWLLDIMRAKGHYTETTDEPVGRGNVSKSTPP